MNEIGGYFELELNTGEHYHKDAIKLNTARNCLEYILKAKKYKKIFIPYYTCDVIMEPIIKCNVNYEFYHINQELEPIKKYELSGSEAFLYINYFGIKQKAAYYLAKIYNKNLIIDNSQAFFDEPLKNIDTFYSARKFFGVPDGAYLYTNMYLDENIEQDISNERMSHLLKRIDIGAQAGYNDFKNNNDLLKNQSIKKMSNLTDNLLKSINYKSAKIKRKNNFNLMNNLLKKHNQINYKFNMIEAPMIYPYYGRKSLKEKLINNKIYIPTYWNNVINNCKQDSVEYNLSENIIPLPIDQRYKSENIKQIAQFIIDAG